MKKYGKKNTKKINTAINDGKILHITTSLADNAKAKDTEFLDYCNVDEGDQIVVEGIYGGIISGDALVTDRFIRSETPSDSFFISPFVCEQRKMVSLDAKCWYRDGVDLRYMTKSVQEVFDKNRGICEHWVAKPEFFDLYGKLLLRVRKNNTGKNSESRDEVAFFVRKVEIYSFSTGISFLVVRIEYGENEPFDSMVDLASNLGNKIAKGGNSSRWIYIDSETREEIDVHKSVMKLISRGTSNNAQGINWFDTSTNQKCNTFHRIIVDRRKKGDVDRLCKMARGFGVSSTIDKKTMNTYSPGNGRKWVIDTNGIASLTWLNGDKENNYDKEFLSGTYQGNLIRYYLPVYILALHEREAFLDYNRRAVIFWREPRKLQELRKSILRFSIWSASNTISTESNYQKFYQELHKELSLESLEQDVAQVVEQVDDYEERKADKRMNGLLAGIGFLTLFSVLVDGTDFLEKLQHTGTDGIDMLDLVHIGFYLVIVGIVLFVWWIGFKRDK